MVSQRKCVIHTRRIISYALTHRFVISCMRLEIRQLSELMNRYSSLPVFSGVRRYVFPYVNVSLMVYRGHRATTSILKRAYVLVSNTGLWNMITSTNPLYYRREIVYPTLVWTPSDPGRPFVALMFFFLVGAILPLIPWLFLRRYPNSIFKYIKSVHNSV